MHQTQTAHPETTQLVYWPYDAHKTGQLLQNAMILSLWNIQQNKMGEDAYNKNSVHWLKNFTRDDFSRYIVL